MSFSESVARIVATNANGLLAKHSSWERVPLRDVFDVQNGFPFESRYFNERGDGIPLLRIRDIVSGTTETFYSGPYQDGSIVKPGDVVVGMDGNFNVRAWRGPEALLNQRVCRLVPRGGYLRELLPWTLQGYLDAINANTSAITVKHLSSRTLEEIPLPLPPASEQGRLLEVLESEMSRLDAARSSLERTHVRLKGYWSSVLRAAVEGRLVPSEAELAKKEGRQYEPASVLLDRILRERHRRWEMAELAHLKKAGAAPKDDKWRVKYEIPRRPDPSKLPPLPEGWTWATLGLMKEFSLYGPRFSSEDYSDRGVLVLRTSDISDGGRVNIRTPPRLNLSEDDYQKYAALRGDLLITRTGSLGTLAVLNDDVRAIPGAYLIQYRLAAPLTVVWYCFQFLKSPAAQAALVGGGRGVGRPNLNAPTIEALPVPLPPLREQERILDEIQRLLSVAEVTTSMVENERSRIGRLRQAVLKWAVEGRLVDQDSAAEPAVTLLSRIRAERVSTTATKKPKNHKKRLAV